MTTHKVLDRLVTFYTVSANNNQQLIAHVEDLLRANNFRETKFPSPCGQKAGFMPKLAQKSKERVC
ncbi:hypothetical protein [Pseudophaeobacter sp.]